MPLATSPISPEPRPAVAETGQNRPLPGIAMRLLAATCIATMFALVKLASDRGVGVVESVFYRQLAGVLVMIPWALAGQGMAALRTERPWAHVSRMLVGLTSMTLNFWAISLLPLAEATTIGFMVPIFATLLSIVILSEKVRWQRWSAILAGFVGVLVVIQPGDGHIPLGAATVALAGAIITGWVSILIRMLGATERASTTVFWFSLSSMVPLGIAMLFVGQGHDATSWAIIVGIGLTGAAAQLALTASLRLAPVSVVLPMDYVSLIFATLYGWLIWDRWPGPSTWLGAPVIIGSGLYIAWREHRLAQRAKAGEA